MAPRDVKDQAPRLMIDIGWTPLFKMLSFVVGIWAVYTLRDVLVMLCGVFVFVAAVNPTIARWQRHMSRLLAVTLFYVLLVVVIAIISSLFLPRLIFQINELARSLPKVIAHIQPVFAGLQPTGSASFAAQVAQEVRGTLNAISNSLLDTTLSIFGGVVTAVTGLVISFYLMLEESNARKFLHQVLPQHRFEPVYGTVRKVSERMGNWVRGQVLLMVILGTASLLAYWAIGLPSPLALGIWAGLCEVIPFVGPVLGVVPALTIALGTGTVVQAVLVVTTYVIVQQLESHVVVPKVMGRAVGLSPVLVILALMTGDKILGLTGAILSIPVAAAISVVAGDWHELRTLWEETASE